MDEVDLLLALGGLVAGVIAYFFIFGSPSRSRGYGQQFQLNSRVRLAGKVRRGWRQVRGNGAKRSRG